MRTGREGMGSEIARRYARGRTAPVAMAAMLTMAAGCGGPPAEEDSAGEAAATMAAQPETGTYEFRLDSERSDPGEFQLSVEESTVHIMTGPAGIAYRPDDVVRSGDFEVAADFVQFGAPVGYREAYGLFVGGLDLDSPDQEYTYLLIRGTGDFLIKRRRGDTTETLVDWTASSAVVAVTEEVAEPENRLAIASIDGETVFLINGVAVHGMPNPEARPYGVSGIRANHRLDIRVENWTLASPPAMAPGTTEGT